MDLRLSALLRDCPTPNRCSFYSMPWRLYLIQLACIQSEINSMIWNTSKIMNRKVMQFTSGLHRLSSDAIGLPISQCRVAGAGPCSGDGPGTGPASHDDIRRTCLQPYFGQLRSLKVTHKPHTQYLSQQHQLNNHIAQIGGKRRHLQPHFSPIFSSPQTVHLK